MTTKKPVDAGLTLIELMVTSMIMVIVIAVVAGIFISVTSAERTVNALTSSANTAQSAANAIETGVRNSSEFIVKAPSGNDQLLVARTANQGATLTWNCRAWYFSAANGGSIRSTATADGTRISAPTAAQLATWTLVASGITPRTGTGIFAKSGAELSVAFNSTVKDGRPVAIQTTVVKRAGSSEAGTCYVP